MLEKIVANELRRRALPLKLSDQFIPLLPSGIIDTNYIRWGAIEGFAGLSRLTKFRWVLHNLGFNRKDNISVVNFLNPDDAEINVLVPQRLSPF